MITPVFRPNRPRPNLLGSRTLRPAPAPPKIDPPAPEPKQELPKIEQSGSKRLKIELYTFVLNDETILPYFLKHYEPLVDKMTFIDSGSTDGTLKLLKGHKVIQTGLTWWDWDAYQQIRDNIWRKSKYDLIFFPDADEILYKKNLRYFLETYQYPIYQMRGYQMVSKGLPKKGDNILSIKTGFPLPLYDKFSIFSPKARIHFDNAHTVTTDEKDICKFHIQLLHYKFIDIPLLLKRAELIKKRVPKDSYCKIIKGNILVEYQGFVRTEKQYTEEMTQMLRKAIPVI